MTAPNLKQIQAQVTAVLKHDPTARAIAIRSSRRMPWPGQVEVESRPFRLIWCDSPLAVREALAGEGEDDGLVVLMNLSDQRLGADVVARFARGRVFVVQAWDMVRDAFQARDIDPRLSGLGWLAETLIEHTSPGGYPPVPSGILDADTAWRCVLQGALGITEPRPDAVTLLQWTMSEGAIERYSALAEPARSSVVDWIMCAAGPAGSAIMACVAAGYGRDTLPLGLVSGVIFGPHTDGNSELAAAAARLERFTGGKRIDRMAGLRWAEPAAEAIRRLEAPVARPWLDRADALMHELHITRYAHKSDILLAGFDARLATYAQALTHAVRDHSGTSLIAAEEVASRVLAHEQVRFQQARTERVVMSLRLLRWLRSASVPPLSFPTLVQAYAAEGGFVDWARLELRRGDEMAVLSAAYAELADMVRTRREQMNRQFARALREWNASGSQASDLVLIERVLDEVVAPLAAKVRVLVLVLDGLSFPVIRELFEDFTRSGWVELIKSGRKIAPPAIAALPTITETSRASLLCGKLTSGANHVEKTGFMQHPALLAMSHPTARPALFHKSELSDGLGLSEAVREAIGARDQRVVAVVYNAVDDHLDGSDQLRYPWSLDDLRIMRPLLHEARHAGRVLVITADHGHVIDERTVQHTYADGDRWRRKAGPVADDEIELTGGRVLAPGGLTTVVAPWSETLRYSSKRNGYHGGVTPQEVVLPLCILAPIGTEIEGWVAAPPVLPEWWEPVERVTDTEPMRAVVPRSKVDVKPRQQTEIFELVPPPVPADWVERLLASPIYAAQRQLAARAAPPDTEVRSFLQALDARGGKLSKVALAQRLGIPTFRVSGLVNAMRRVLNIDQNPVLSLDEATGLVELNRELLRVQFQIQPTRAPC